MRIILLRSLALLASFASATAALGATPDDDVALRQLKQTGVLPVAAAGPYVVVGTYRIQVQTKLGRPDVALGDGTWLYHDRTIEGSDARGTLVVRFSDGRVTELVLATPKVIAAWRSKPERSLADVRDGRGLPSAAVHPGHPVASAAAASAQGDLPLMGRR